MLFNGWWANQHGTGRSCVWCPWQNFPKQWLLTSCCGPPYAAQGIHRLVPCERRWKNLGHGEIPPGKPAYSMSYIYIHTRMYVVYVLYTYTIQMIWYDMIWYDMIIYIYIHIYDLYRNSFPSIKPDRWVLRPRGDPRGSPSPPLCPIEVSIEMRKVCPGGKTLEQR